MIMNSEEFFDFYEILGVEDTATIEEIKKAYRKKALELHPDANVNKNLTEEQLTKMREEFTRANVAYKTLTEEEEKAKYDQKRKEHYEKIRRQQEAKQQEAERRRQEEAFRRAQQRASYSWDYAYHATGFDRGTYERQNRADETRSNTQNRSRTSSTYHTQNTRRQESTMRSQTQKRASHKKENFFQSLKRQYQEVRRDEKKYNFKNRHQDISAEYYDAFADKVTSIPKEVLYYAGSGATHVLLELFYQLAKLRYLNKDAFTKFVIRNRKLVTAAILVGVMVSTGVFQTDKTPTGAIREGEDLAATTTTTIPNEEELTLNRYYKIESGDTLSELAEEANISAEDLRIANGLSSSTIYQDDTIKIPYHIKSEELKYYTQKIQAEGISLESLAKMYETDVDTLFRLNEEAIVRLEDGLYALTDELVVPKFITKAELKDLKAQQDKTY